VFLIKSFILYRLWTAFFVCIRYLKSIKSTRVSRESLNTPVLVAVIYFLFSNKNKIYYFKKHFSESKHLRNIKLPINTFNKRKGGRIQTMLMAVNYLCLFKAFKLYSVYS